MKIPIYEAAKRLSLHPCELVLNLASMVGSFDDFYPEVDEGYIETIEQLHYHSSHFRITDKTLIPQISKDSQTIISMLYSKTYWKSNTVNRDFLKNHYCKDIANLDTAIKELQHEDIIIVKKSGRVLSLNPKKRKLIEESISDIDL